MLVAGGFAAYSWMSTRNATSAARVLESKASVLALKVNRVGEDFEISWDHSSMAVRQASHGTLRIKDGETTRTVQFDGAQLREGRILYSPLFTELNFRLEVGTSDHITDAASVQVLAWDGALAAEAPASSRVRSGRR